MNPRCEALFDIARGKDVDLPDPPPLTERYVDPAGPLDAFIAAIGEAPGRDEVDQGKPFVGPSGKLIRAMARAAGINFDKIYRDNVYPYYPPGGKIKNILPEDLKAATAQLFKRLEALTHVRVIVPVGNIALHALTGLDSITKHRGSIYERLVVDRSVKMVPLIHPAAILRGQKQWTRRGYLDWKRIKEESMHEGMGAHPFPQRSAETNPTSHFVEDFYERSLRAPRLCIDIETKPSEGRILCVGFSLDRKEAMVLTWDIDWHRYWIRKLCEGPADKVLWNQLYDRWWLANEGVVMPGRIIDGMTLMHCLVPTDNVSLAYASSIMTREPFWKDNSKDEDDKSAEENWEKFKQYNGLDVMVPLEIVPQLEADLEKQGLVQFHTDHYERLVEPMLDVMLQGVNIDHESRTKVWHELRQEAVAARDALAEYNDGEPLFTLTTQRDKAVWNILCKGGDIRSLPYKIDEIQTSFNRINAKNVSGPRLKDMIYNKHGLPVQLKRRETGEETETLDIFALRSFGMSTGTFPKSRRY